MECLQKYLPECSNDSGAVALRKMIQDIVCLNHSFILYPVYVLLNATAPLFFYLDIILRNLDSLFFISCRYNIEKADQKSGYFS